MLDVKLLREESDLVKRGIKAKGADPKLVDTFLSLDEKWRKLTKKLDDLRAEQKKLSEARKIEEAKSLKEQIKKLEEEEKAVAAEREEVLYSIPNLSLPDVPEGKDETENKVIRSWGKPPTLDFQPKDHVELGENLGLIEVKKAGEVTGTRFAYLKGDAALLEFALIQFGFSVLTDEKILKTIADKAEKGYPAKPFVPIVPPQMIRPEVYQKMARLEPKEERYYIPSDDVYLIGSAEHTLGPLHMDEVLHEEDLPIRYAGFSTSFRREAGSYGKDTRGILRVHQFDKLELESFTRPEDGVKEQDFFVAIQEYLMQALRIPYQVIAISTGDMAGPDARQIDIETWMPGQPSAAQGSGGQGRYRETHTADYMADYQARRLNTKVRRKDGKTEFVHMNDATAFAIGRTLIAVMENYQIKDGRIKIPEALQKYVGKDVIG